MKNNNSKVALNITQLSVPQKINKGRLIVDSVISHPAEFPNPIPTMTAITSAINDLETAWNDAADGGKTKTALMHDKENHLNKLLNHFANYVEITADGDEEIVHKAGLDTKKTGTKHLPDFEVLPSADRGAVLLRCKSHPKTIYAWQYCKAPLTKNWIEAKTTDVCQTFFGDLESNVMYFFRVVLINKTGRHASDAKGIVIE
jgi:hypothetical protein